MECVKPITKVNRSFPCGRCELCVRYRRRVWSHRLILESRCHKDSVFVTLTYDDDKLPENKSLRPVDVQNWLKDIRHAIEPKRIRFFLSGEYGSDTKRPHYHVMLFGIDAVTAGGFDGSSGIVKSSWGKGFTVVRDITESRCAYVAGYVDKKIIGMEPKRDPRDRSKYIDGRVAEFTRMSMRPGIGRGTATIIASALSHGGIGTNFIQSNGDMPTALRHGRVLLPLGRYLRGKIRDDISGGVLTHTKGVSWETLAQWFQFKRMRELQAEDEIIAKDQKKTVGEIKLDRLKQKCKNIIAQRKLSPKGSI